MKANPSSWAAARPRTFCTFLLCGVAAALFGIAGTATTVLNNYPNTTVQLGGNTTVIPDAAPGNTTSINVSTSTNFKGRLEGNPGTGVVRVTDAHPAGTYPVTVTGFNGGGGTWTATFTLTVTTPATCNPVTFTAPANFPAGNSPRSVAVGDFNGDGKQDLAISIVGNVSIVLGNGTGSFGAGANFTVGTSAESVTVADFNGDGRQDLVTTNAGSNTISVLLGDGAGGFGAASNFGVGSVPRSVAVGDFNGDGRQDLAVANQLSDNVSVFLGDGAGSFSAATTFDTGTNPNSVAVGDFNGDGKQDLAFANRGPNTASVLLGNGAGGFSAATSFAVGTDPAYIAIGDFNGDGNQDLAVTNTGSNNVSVLLGDGAGSFGTAANFATGIFPQSVTVGDFNGDGQQDLVVANTDSDNVSILLGNGMGSFSAPTNFSTGTTPSSVAVGDFNGDGKQDLAVANFNSNNVSILLRQCIAATPTPTPSSTPSLTPTASPTPTPAATPTPTPCETIFSENFDGATPPGLPVGWTSAATGVEVKWVTSTITPANAPNDVFAPDVPNKGNTELVTPAISLPAGGGRLTFQNLFNMQAGFDGMVLEISINGGAFADILTAGGSFSTGGYTQVITGVGNPIAGRMAWSGLSDGTTAAPAYITTTVNLPVAANGQSVRLKWRAATDINTVAADAAGVRIDNIVIVPASCGIPIPTPTPPSTATPGGTPVPTATPGSGTPTPTPAATPTPTPAGGRTGIALVEAYDLSQNVDSKLANLSTRAFCGTQDNVIIAGFILGIGHGDDNVIVRGLGPSLAASGVPNVLANPTLDLRDANGTLISSNNDWQDNPAQAAIISAAGLAPGNDLESAIAAALPPGLYTALLAGLNNGTGIGLVEIYDRGDGSGGPAPSPSPAGTPSAQAINLSTRMHVEGGDKVGIGGFIVQGVVPKRVIVRAIGPSLTRYGLIDVLADPVLELHGPTGFVTVTNDNWRDAQEAEIQATGLPPTNNLESAIVATLAPGNYTAIVRGNGQ